MFKKLEPVIMLLIIFGLFNISFISALEVCHIAQCKIDLLVHTTLTSVSCIFYTQNIKHTPYINTPHITQVRHQNRLIKHSSLTVHKLTYILDPNYILILVYKIGQLFILAIYCKYQRQIQKHITRQDTTCKRIINLNNE